MAVCGRSRKVLAAACRPTPRRVAMMRARRGCGARGRGEDAEPVDTIVGEPELYDIAQRLENDAFGERPGGPPPSQRKKVARARRVTLAPRPLPGAPPERLLAGDGVTGSGRSAIYLWPGTRQAELPAGIPVRARAGASRLHDSRGATARSRAAASSAGSAWEGAHDDEEERDHDAEKAFVCRYARPMAIAPEPAPRASAGSTPTEGEATPQTGRSVGCACSVACSRPMPPRRTYARTRR